MSYNRQITISCDTNQDADCTVEAALSLIGGKWKLKIYKVLRDGKPLRFSGLNKSLINISEKTLASQLKEMENDGIVSKMIYPEVPPRVEYQLTHLGQSLEPVFLALHDWGKAYINHKES
jgi:DNA-binding HxlR family transcriptional regulator